MSNFVSVIIPTRDRAGELAQTLHAIERSCCHDGDTYSAELIVVDNGSADETAEVVKGFQSSQLNVRYVYESRKGRSICLNRALLEAKGDIILLLDDDVRPQQGWIPTMCAPIWERRADAVAGGITMAPHLRRNWMEDFHRVFLTSTEALDQGAMDITIGANCAFSRNVLDKVPGFDPEIGAGTALGFCEDILFSLQLVDAGYRLTAVFDHPVTHHFDPSRLSRHSFVRRAEAEGRSRAYIARHWEQREIRFPFLRVCDAFVRLQVRRRLPGARWPHKEGIAEWEFWSICRLAFLQQYRRERRRARHYSDVRARKALKEAIRVDRDVSGPQFAGWHT
jgi:glycosyltransferase involved in cell wall biosynthesis